VRRLAILLILASCGGDTDDRDGDGVVDRKDCAPNDKTISPKVTEKCDGIDNNCDGNIDETWDSDGDGYPTDDDACVDGDASIDCNDSDDAIFPGAQELCDGIDNDCSGAPDDDDRDGDGVGSCDDCDDGDPFVYPGAAEACDGEDNDCSGGIDEPWDIDGDGRSPCDGDCNDDNPDISKGLPELCDGLDNDCDGFIDEDPTCWDCTLDGAYDYCAVPVTWKTAESTCDGMGGILVVMDDLTENDLVVGFAQTRLDSFWIGLNDLDQEGIFEWVNGTSLTFDDYEVGEPNGGNNSNCVGVNAVSWQWVDLPCTAPAMFVCEY